MKRYRTRPGVVLTTISGQNVLVSAKSVQGLCPFTAQINETTAFCWRVLEEGADMDTLLRRVREEYEIEDPAAAREAIRNFLEQMLQLGYLLRKGEQKDE